MQDFDDYGEINKYSFRKNLQILILNELQNRNIADDISCADLRICHIDMLNYFLKVCLPDSSCIPGDEYREVSARYEGRRPRGPLLPHQDLRARQGGQEGSRRSGF